MLVCLVMMLSRQSGDKTDLFPLDNLVTGRTLLTAWCADLMMLEDLLGIIEEGSFSGRVRGQTCAARSAV